MSYSVYILRTEKNTLYTGYAKDVNKRITVHQAGKGSKYLRSFKNLTLVYCKNFDTKSEALIHEAALKKLSKKEKEKLCLPHSIDKIIV